VTESVAQKVAPGFVSSYKVGVLMLLCLIIVFLACLQFMMLVLVLLFLAAIASALAFQQEAGTALSPGFDITKLAPLIKPVTVIHAQPRLGFTYNRTISRFGPFTLPPVQVYCYSLATKYHSIANI
jgi:hypothetical protein